MNDDELDDEIRRAHAGATAPPELEARVVARLTERGLIGPRPRSRRAWPWIACAAAAVTVVLVYALGTGDSDDGVDHHHYALVLDTVSENYSQMEPEAAAALAIRYDAWLDRIRASGRLVESLYLASSGATAGIEGVSGVVVVQVRSRSEVDAIVADSPHVARGGAISVRRVERAEFLRSR